MTEILKISYLNCGFCTAKNHCQSCGEELSRALVEKPAVTAAAVNIPDHSLQIAYDLDPDGLEDMLDAIGLLME